MSFHIIDNPNFGNISGIHFYDDNLGTVIEDSTLHLTTDGGLNWFSRTIPNMVAEKVAVSVQGTDTLFVIAEGKYRLLRYFHGFNGTIHQLYSSQNFSDNQYPSIAINGNNVVVMGSYTNISSGAPIYFRSKDHGNSWQSIGDMDPQAYQFSAVTKRQNDTMIVGRSNFLHPNNFAYQGYGEYWLQNMDYKYATSVITGMTRYTCDGNSCLGYLKQNNHAYIVMQKGVPLVQGSFVKDLSEISHVSQEDIQLIMQTPDEFLTVYRDADSSGTFHISAYHVKWRGPDPSRVEILDSIIYNFQDSSSLTINPGGICKTTNYIYFTLAPRIYRIERAKIQLEEYNESNSNQFEIGYSQSGNDLLLFGLDQNENYEFEIYSINGQLIDQGIIRDKHLIIEKLKSSIHFLMLKDSNGVRTWLKFIKS